MGRLTLVTGGAKSGKSAFAEQLALKQDGRLVYIATGQVCDAGTHCPASGAPGGALADL